MADNTMIKVGAVAVAAYVAYTQGWLSFLGIAAPAAAATPVTSAPVAAAPTSAVPVITTPVSLVAPVSGGAVNAAAAPTLSAVQAATILAAGAPAAGLGVDAWGWYLNNVLGPYGMVAPDPAPIFGAAIPNFDRSQPVASAQYWSIMGPALNKVGLNGLGMYWRTK